MKNINEGRFDLAATNCAMRTEGNPGLTPRNKANKKLFLSAAANPTSTVVLGY
jgi:hypothetical protein